MNKPEINAASMEDVNVLLDALVPHYKEMLSAFELLDALGVDATMAPRKVARDDIERAGLLILALVDLFKELHATQCKHPGECDIAAGEEAMQQIESSIMQNLRTVRQESEAVANGLVVESHPDPEIVARLTSMIGDVPPNNASQASSNPATGFYL